MGDNQVGLIPGHGRAVARFADAMLRSLGGTQVTLRIADPASGSSNSQLGLEAPEAEDLQISPAMIKPLAPAEGGRRRIEVVVSAHSLRTLAKSYGVQDIVAWLLEAQGVLQRDQILRIADVTVERYLDTDCLYHLTATE
ncbi:MAG TPA: hypothetical protein VH575_05150 [Gemmataceae bacterium]|jgi:hypothetical protein